MVELGFYFIGFFFMFFTFRFAQVYSRNREGKRDELMNVFFNGAPEMDQVMQTILQLYYGY